ncbi:hypothetical protein [Pseudomonas syringae]|nr:hypothetical protein [Pseudomonas syringae]
MFYDSQMVAGDTIVGFTASARFNTGLFAVNAGCPIWSVAINLGQKPR